MKKKNATEKINKVIYRLSLVKMIIFLSVIIFMFIFGFIFETQIEKILNPNSFDYSKIDNSNLNIYFLNVGQGDCAFVNFPDGKTMLIDSGTPDSESFIIDFLINNIYKNKDLVIDYVLLTHSDTDHSGGMLKIMQTFQVYNVLRPKIYDCYNNSQIDCERDKELMNNYCIINDEYYHNLIESFYNEPYCNVNFIDIDDLNNNLKICSTNLENYYELKFYAPIDSYINKTNIETNEISSLFTISYSDKIVMFTGDISSKIEEEVLKCYDLPTVDILKVAHHGSNYSTSENFVSKINPKNSVISVGANNSYGHPTTKVLNILSSYNSSIYRTDEDGNVIFEINNEGEIFNYCDNVVFYVEMEYLLIVGVIFCIIVLNFVEKIPKKIKKQEKTN